MTRQILTLDFWGSCISIKSTLILSFCLLHVWCFVTLKFRGYFSKLSKTDKLFLKHFAYDLKNSNIIINKLRYFPSTVNLISFCLMDHNFINVSVVMIPVSTVKVMDLTFFEVPKDMFKFFLNSSKCLKWRAELCFSVQIAINESLLNIYFWIPVYFDFWLL